ncbi:type 1 fimbrial major subunit FimA [Pseudomonas triclosanedens]|nr:type 1 fimbrial major subunit FimA [Pseudomonas triclosanedens]
MIMMKKALLAAAVASLMAGAMTAQAATTVDGGTVHFTGQLINAACVVDVNSQDQTVDLGQYRTATFNAVGARSASVPFTIQLKDCDTTVSSSAAVAFTGQQDAANDTLLAVNSAVTNGTTATGVGIEILDTDSKVLTPDGTAFSTPQTLIDGFNTLHFSAAYVATAASATAGRADADATFVVQYP